MKKRTNKEVNELLNSYSLRNLDNIYLNIDKKMNIIDSNGYKYHISLYEIIKLKGKLKYIINTNPYCTENIKIWLKLKNQHC